MRDIRSFFTVLFSGGGSSFSSLLPSEVGGGGVVGDGDGDDGDDVAGIGTGGFAVGVTSPSTVFGVVPPAFFLFRLMPLNIPYIGGSDYNIAIMAKRALNVCVACNKIVYVFVR